MKYQYIILLLVTVFIYSCNESKEYLVDPAFTDYMFRFEQEAAKRGQNIDLKLSGLIVEFATLNDSKAGLCHYENPIRIEIDRAYWNKISNSANADLMKENLLFHELGHGILNRRHNNEILENGDWKSIMCGGEKVENKTWNINYRGNRRTYYIDELFNESIQLPLYLYKKLNIDTTGFKRVFVFGFDTDSKTDTGWDLKSNQSFSLMTENKQLKFTSLTNNSNAVMLNINSSYIDIKNSFLIEMDIKCISSNPLIQYGIAFGTSNANADTTEYFRIDKQQFMYPGNSANYSYYSQLKNFDIKKDGYNKLKIIKIKDILYYFINDIYAYQTEPGILGGGRNFGFIAPPFSITYIDNFRIGIIPTSSSYFKINPLVTISTLIYTINSGSNTLTD